jgi:hypothetical protein
MVASTSIPVDPMAWAGYAAGTTQNGPGWVRISEVPAGWVVIESGARVRVEPHGPTDKWMVAGRASGLDVAVVSVNDRNNTFRSIDIAAVLTLNPSLLEGLDVGSATVARSTTQDDTLRLTSPGGGAQEVPIAEFVNAHIEDLRHRLALLVDVG